MLDAIARGKKHLIQVLAKCILFFREQYELRYLTKPPPNIFMYVRIATLEGVCDPSPWKHTSSETMWGSMGTVIVTK